MDLYPTRDDMEALLQASLDDLLANDAILLRNDVSERAITHKLAQHMQTKFRYLDVDCEYNRDVTRGANATKSINVLRDRTREERLRLADANDETEFTSISTYPDIIVHHRGTNRYNLLVVEVKKTSSRARPEHDLEKLVCFTEATEENVYRYRYGAFVVLGTRNRAVEVPVVRWFQEGRET